MLLFTSCGEEETNTIFKKFPSDPFDDSYVHEIRINTYNEDGIDSLFAYKKMRDSLEVTQYLPSRLILDSFLLDSTGIRFKGESSFQFTKNNKKSFKISLNRFNKGQAYGPVKNFNLNNCFKDPTFMREKLMLDLLRKQNLPAARSAYAKVWLNDQYLGVYLLVEEIDKHFLDVNFTNHDGNLYLGEPQAYLEDLGESKDEYLRKYKKKKNNAGEDWSDLVNLIRTIHKKTKKKNSRRAAEELDTLLNTENMLKAWAINNMFVNPDAFNMLYPHNYLLYHEPTSNKFQWITYDYNLGFAAWNPKFTLEQVYTMDPLFIADPSTEQNFREKIFSNKKYEAFYKIYMSGLLKDEFSIDQMGHTIDKWAKLIRTDVYADSLKMFSNEDFEKNMTEHIGDPTDPGAFTPGLKAFLVKRRDFLIREMKKENLFK